VEVAKGTGATVIDNLVAPPAVQVMLRVRFAEVGRSALKDFAFAFNALNTDKLDLSPRSNWDWEGNTISDGLVRFFLSSPNASIEGIMRASITKGNFKLLAEPNLLTLPGKEASFLAGGEFPYPSLQGASGNNAVSIDVARRSRHSTRDFETRTAPGCMASSAATSPAARPSTTVPQNACHVRSWNSPRIESSARRKTS
jgi:Flp pilus assembly secretin CpaC